MVGETPIAWGEAVQVFTIVIVTTLARNNGASGYRKEQSDPDMINHFRSPLFHKQTDHNITQNEVNKGKIICSSKRKIIIRCCNLYIVPHTQTFTETLSNIDFARF